MIRTRRWWAIGLCAAVIGLPTPGAHAQPLTFRIEVSPFTAPPRHSYAAGEVGDWFLFFGGISGQGLHSLVGGGEPGAVPPSFPVGVFSDQIAAFNYRTGEVLTSPVNLLPPDARLALTITNMPSVQVGSDLLIYGGFGPTADGADWDTRRTVTRVNLPAVLAALQQGDPAPASAFTVQTAPDARVAGATIVRLDAQRYALIGGSLFLGDYAGNTPFANLYSESVHIYDAGVSITTPVRSFSGATLHRRDMNALPMTYSSVEGPPVPGFAIAGGVFQNGFFVWENPLFYRDGDPGATDEFFFLQKMNQYESGALSFYSQRLDENRQILFGGISSSRFVDGAFVPDIGVPWVTDITQVRVRGGMYLDETVIGQTPLPTTNVHTFVAPRIPRLPNGQILLDELPASEALIARMPCGLRATEPAAAPITVASGAVWNIYATFGLPGDVNRDGRVDGVDIAYLLSAWGSDATVPDFDLSGVVGPEDLTYLLARFGSTSP